MTPSSWFVPQIVVSTLKIERYNRVVAAISEKDDSDDGQSPFTGITAATSDSSGDWVVRENVRGGRGPLDYALFTTNCFPLYGLVF